MHEIKCLEVHTEKGVQDELKIYFRRDGKQQPGVEPGNVIILQCLPHTRLYWQGADFLYEVDGVKQVKILCCLSGMYYASFMLN